MNLHNIQVISRYEARLLRRSWLFRIFAILALLVITMLHITTQSNMSRYQWNMVTLSSSIPFVNIYIFNIAQSIIAIFLAGDFMKRDKKLDTAEVTYVRPMSNTDYIAGKTWGIVTVFVGLNIVALAIAAMINILASESAFNPWAYVFYLLTLSIPSLIFILSLSFALISLLKNQAVTLILLLGFIGATLIYLGNAEHGAFDFFAATLPNIFSDVTGHPELKLYLIQRISFLLLGLGLLTFTIALIKRLPQHPKKRIALNIIGGIILIAGIGCCLNYVNHYRTIDRLRSDYLTKYQAYSTSGKDVQLLSSEITLKQDAHILSAHNRLLIQNKSHREINPILVYLNPGLEITDLSDNNGKPDYTRDQQVVVIERSIRPYEKVELTIDYRGEVSESICYLDVPDNELYDTKTGSSVLRYGKKYVFVSDDYTLLTPEALWYPVTSAPINSENPYNIQKNFTDFTLKVLSPGEKTVLSQGTSRQSGDTLIFTNAKPLPAISLVMGEYEKKSIQLDSLQIELYHFKGHDYFSGEFTHLTDTLVQELTTIKNDYEVRKNRDYPFRKLVITETPVSFASYMRTWKGMSEFVQPEMVFLPEMGTTLPNSNFKLAKKNNLEWERRRNRILDDTEVELRVLREFIHQVFLSENHMTEEGNLFINDLFSNGPDRSSKLNKYEISSLYFNHANYFYSANFPVMDILLNVMMKQEEVQRSGWWRRFSGMNDSQRAAEYLKDHSFEQAVMDKTLPPEVFYELLKLKANYMKNYILAQHSLSEFTGFMKEYTRKHQFRAVNFTALNNDFIRAFGINLMDHIPVWYTMDRTPFFIVRGLDLEEVVIDDFTRYMTRFTLYNPTDVEGIVSVRVEEGGRRRGPWGGNREEAAPKHYIIPPKAYREIKTLAEERPNNVVLNTNISQNLPSETTFSLPGSTVITQDTLTGIFTANSSLFAYNPKEITVDNEDPGFRLIESNQKNTLQSLFNIGTEDRYQNMNFWLPPSRWTATVGSNFYGDYIRSGYYKKAGSGRNMAEWSATISIAGYYEIYVYNSSIRGRNEEDTFQYYTISHDDGKDEVSVQTNKDVQSWVSLGTYYLNEGKVTVTLNDKGASTRQLIFADAVRWEYKINQK